MNFEITSHGFNVSMFEVLDGQIQTVLDIIEVDGYYPEDTRDRRVIIQELLGKHMIKRV